MSQNITLAVDLNTVTSSQREKFDAQMRQQGWQGGYKMKETDWPKYLGVFPPQATQYLIQCSIENAVAAAARAAGLAGNPKYEIIQASKI